MAKVTAPEQYCILLLWREKREEMAFLHFLLTFEKYQEYVIAIFTNNSSEDSENKS